MRFQHRLASGLSSSAISSTPDRRRFFSDPALTIAPAQLGVLVIQTQYLATQS